MHKENSELVTLYFDCEWVASLLLSSRSLKSKYYACNFIWSNAKCLCFKYKKLFHDISLRIADEKYYAMFDAE